MKQRTCQRENESSRRVSPTFFTNQRDKFENARDGKEKCFVESTCRRGTCHRSSGWRRTVVDRLSMMMRIGRCVSCRDIVWMRIESRRRLIGSCRHCCLEGSEDDVRLSRNDDVRTKEERSALYGRGCWRVRVSVYLFFRFSIDRTYLASSTCLYTTKRERERSERAKER